MNFSHWWGVPDRYEIVEKQKDFCNIRELMLQKVKIICALCSTKDVQIHHFHKVAPTDKHSLVMTLFLQENKDPPCS